MHRSALLAALVAIFATPAQAHFGMIIPDHPMLDQADGREVELTIGFGHPFTPEGLVMEPPRSLQVTSPEGTLDLTGDLEPADYHGAPGFRARHTVASPGVLIFHMEPEPYWEPAEDAFILHYTKTYMSAFGDDEGWDTELGLPIEIVPLTRPFGLWAGNVFQGIVKRDGVAQPFAEVEVEFYDADGTAAAPSGLMAPQTVRADGNGVLTYAAPRPGWWGFAALATADETIEREGVAKSLEIGGVIWVHFEAWQEGE